MSDNLYQRGDIWYARIQVAGVDRRKSLQTANRKEAERRLDKFLKETSPYKGTIRQKYEDVVEDFLASAEGRLKPRTIKRYEDSLTIMQATFGGKFWDQITKVALLDYIASRKAEQVKIPTIKRDLTALSQASDHAIENNWAGTNPVTLLPKRQLRYKTPVFRRPSKRSVELGIESCYGNLKPLARFLLATGMRLNEGVTLGEAQIDLVRKVATLSDTKNHRTRTVSLNSAARSILKGRKGSPLFPAIDRYTGASRPYKQASTNWGEAQLRAVATAKKQRWTFERFRLHDLRHMYAIDYLANGGSIYQLQIELGHGSITQTEWYLQFLSPEEQMKVKYTAAQMAAQP